MRQRGFRPFGVALVSMGLVLGVATAQQAATQTTTSDAQIESNVLKALAGASELSTQNIKTSTVYGVVTLTGNVHDEAMRTKAENLAARAEGVKKVVDELSLGDTPAPAVAQAPPALPDGQLPPDQQAGPPAGQVLQSDGTYAPAPQDEGDTAVPAQAGNAPPLPDGRQPMFAPGTAPRGPRGGQQACR